MQTNTTELMTSIQSAIRDVVNNQSLEVKADSRLSDDLGLESIDLLDVSSELENTIGRELDFREIADYVSKKTGQTADMKIICVQDMVDFISAQN